MHDGPEAGRPPVPTLEATLYDAHAARLYAHCWSLIGHEAADAVQDTFAAVGRLGPTRGNVVLWLHSLARTACMHRGAFDRGPAKISDLDPLRRALARLRADHREALVLFAGDWLDVPDMARLLGVATDTVRQLIQAAGTHLERAVLDTLMHEPSNARHDDIITAFEKGRLAVLLADRVPARPPAGLREHVLATAARRVAAARERAQAAPDAPATAAAQTGPLVVIGPRPTAQCTITAGRRARRATEAAGLAAAAAAAVGLFVAWTAPGSNVANGGLTSLIPGSGDGRQTSAQPTAPQWYGAAPQTTVTAPLTAVSVRNTTSSPTASNMTSGPLLTTPTSGDPQPSPPDERPGYPDTPVPPTSTPAPSPTPTDPSTGPRRAKPTKSSRQSAAQSPTPTTTSTSTTTTTPTTTSTSTPTTTSTSTRTSISSSTSTATSTSFSSSPVSGSTTPSATPAG